MTSWRTPRVLFDRLDSALGGFSVDAAADETNHLVSSWYGPGSVLGEDALAVDEWLNPAWCNPPYGKGLGRWLDKFLEQGARGVGIVSLLPAYVERKWWHEKVVRPGADIIFLVGRVQFDRLADDGTVVPGTQPRDPSALVIYGPSANGRVGWLDWKREKNAQVSSDRDQDDQGGSFVEAGRFGEGEVGVR